jgi:hypothetical protein
MTTSTAWSPERRARRAAAALALLAALVCLPRAAAAADTGSEALVQLLLRLGLPAEAAVEARREMLVGGEAAVAPRTAFEIGMKLALAGDAARAAPFLMQAAGAAEDPTTSDRWNLAGGVALLRAGAIPQALHAFLRVETFGASPASRRDAARLGCIAQVMARDAAAARACVRALAAPGAKLSEETEDALSDLAIRPGRRAVVGGILSALLPGLGQATAGHPGDAFLALLVNGGWAAATYFLLADGAYLDAALISVGVGFRYYAGNIYNGSNAWRAAAERRQEEASRTLIERVGAAGTP